MFVSIPLKILGVIIMVASIIVLALANIVDSPSMFVDKTKIVFRAVNNMWKDAKIEHFIKKIDRHEKI